jgi:hypothetical protein
MTTFLFEILLGLFWVVLAFQLVRWIRSTVKIGAFRGIARHVSRSTNPIHFWMIVGWGAFISIISLAAGVFSLAHGAFGIEMPFPL